MDIDTSKNILVIDAQCLFVSFEEINGTCLESFLSPQNNTETTTLQSSLLKVPISFRFDQVRDMNTKPNSF